ncbi:MAG: hypothetical protein ACFFCW_20810 [Candidatus Hodarchaeota archaeon]
MKYPFSLVSILRIPHIPFIILSLGFLVWYTLSGNLHGVLPSGVGVVLFTLLHSVTRGSWVVLGDHEIEIRFGCLAHFSVRYDVIDKVEPVDHPWIAGLGIRYMGNGVYAFVTNTNNVIELTLNEVERVKFSVLPIRFRVQAIRLSPQNSATFLDEIKMRIVRGYIGVAVNLST